jgi:hypothetical protein
MKKTLLLSLILSIALSNYAQFTALLKKNHKAVAPTSLKAANGFELPVVGQHPINSSVSNKSIMDDPITAVTRYDLQTNGSVQRRCYFNPDDQTIGATATWSTQDASWTDRGTGYNYFNGTTWGALPASRVESMRTGWPSYCPYGATGELIISHQATGPLVMNTRSVKGTGAWTQTVLPALPPTIPMMFWPRVVTNGTNHMNIHIIALTGPTANGGVVYNGMDGALVYSHSLDGGASWSDWIQPADLNSSNYAAFGGDTYSFAEPHGDTLAFTIGNGFYDQLLLKSTDNGTTWTKTVIHHSLYNLGGSSPNYFNAPDGTNAIALDNQGMAHVVFGLTADSGTNTAWFYNILAQGIVYWNEYQPQLRQDLNPDSLLATGNLVGWVKDTSFFSLPLTQIAYYSKSLTSFPTLVIDSYNRMGLVFAGATTLLDPNNFNLRHIFGRNGLLYNGVMHWCDWDDTLTDITGDWIQYNFAECMYPSASPTTDNNVYILFQRDDYGGSYVQSTLTTGTWQGQTSPDDNSITLIKWGFSWGCPPPPGVNEKQEKPILSVSQNVPNPFDGLTEVNVYHQNSGDIYLKVTNITGQTIMTLNKTNVFPGVSKFVIDGSQLAPGVYFYTVQQGDQKITKKMVVE